MQPSDPWWPRLKAFVTPRYDELGWAPLWTLLYLMFLFTNWANRPVEVWLLPTVLSLVVFLPLYFVAYRRSGRRVLAYAATIAMLGWGLTPFNLCANTYLIYASCFLVHAGLSLRRIVATIAAGAVVYALVLVAVGLPMQYVGLTTGITLLLAVAITSANYFHREKRLRQAELKLSHDEVRRLGALAERERIGRDLHDLLGHTLSLITLKSELAARLFERDPQAARCEIVEVERVARDALAQVRRAVTGIRAAGLAAELASARLLLESCDVRLDYRLGGKGLGDTELPPELETVLALVVREAVTNIQRHSGAARARVELAAAPGEALLRIEDDGRGGLIEPGNGLSGMRERLRALGGRLEIHSTRGQGTILVAALPLSPRPPIAPAMRELAR